MSARLRPMREDEFPAYVERSKAGYAEDMIRNGGMEPDVARRKADADIAALIPDAYVSDVELRVVEDESGTAVGRVVYAERERHGSGYVFVYDLEIDEDRRGRGLGRAAMVQLEAEVRNRGLDTVELNVFGGNEIARNLYRSLGFDERFVQMGKRLP